MLFLVEVCNCIQKFLLPVDSFQPMQTLAVQDINFTSDFPLLGLTKVLIMTGYTVSCIFNIHMRCRCHSDLYGVLWSMDPKRAAHRI